MNDDRRAPEDRQDADQRPPRRSQGAGSYLGHGLQFAVSVVVFLYLGQWLDRKLGTAPWMLLACVFLGAGGSFYSIYRRLMADLERDEAERRR